MIQSTVGFCFMVLGLTVAAPASKKGAYAPAPPGERPTCAPKGMTFCEDVDKYPAKLIQKLLQMKSPDSFDFFVDESEGLEEPPDHVLLLNEETEKERGGAGTRSRRSVQSDPEDAVLSRTCSVASEGAAPRVASKATGEWRLTTPEETSEVAHKIQIRICDEKEECRKSCTQFYTPFVKSSKSDTQEEDVFWVPSSCRCFDESDNLI